MNGPQPALVDKPQKNVQPKEEMKTHPHTAVDGLAMHIQLLIQKLYDDPKLREHLSFDEWIEKAKKMKTFYVHTKTFKRGNNHFDDTESSVQRVLEALQADLKQFISSKLDEMNQHEHQVYDELCETAKTMTFQEDSTNIQTR